MASMQNILISPEKIRRDLTKHVYTHEYKDISSVHSNSGLTPYQINVQSNSMVNSSTDNIQKARGTIESHKERYLKEAE